jgi:hypothetical protein
MPRDLQMGSMPEYTKPNMTPTKPVVKKKATATKKAAAPVVGKNLARLTAAKIVPKDYAHLTPAEKTALESLSSSEVSAIISTGTKLGKKYFAKHAAHGMYY